MIGNGLRRDAGALLHIDLDFSCKQKAVDVHQTMTNRVFCIGQITDEVTLYLPRECILATFRLDLDSLKHVSRTLLR